MLKHAAYVASLPTPPVTPLYYAAPELALLQGTDVAAGVAQRRAQWGEEAALVAELDAGLTWDRYLAVCTLLSSRSFPNLLLKGESARGMSESEPVLAPGLDLLNREFPTHSRVSAGADARRARDQDHMALGALAGGHPLGQLRVRRCSR